MPGRESVSFIVRLWLEPTSGAQHGWRGHVQHVQSGRAEYFRELGQLKDFLELIGGMPFPFERADNTGAGERRP